MSTSKKQPAAPAQPQAPTVEQQLAALRQKARETHAANAVGDLHRQLTDARAEIDVANAMINMQQHTITQLENLLRKHNIDFEKELAAQNDPGASQEQPPANRQQRRAAQKAAKKTTAKPAAAANDKAPKAK